MGFYDGMDIAASGLTAERLRMDTTAQNLANAQTPGYRRRSVVFQEVLEGAQAKGVQASAIVDDATPNRRVHDPGNPAADAQGYLSMPNVTPVTEMVDLIDSSRGYEANVNAMQSIKQMLQRTFEVLK